MRSLAGKLVFQLFSGEEFYQHRPSFDRSSLTRWRQRIGEEKLAALVQESLSVATRTDAAKPSDCSKVIVDTTLQEKAVAFPTDAKLRRRARERLVRLATKHSVVLRQSCEQMGKHALIAHQRYTHAKQFKRATRRCAKSELSSAAWSAILRAGSRAARRCATFSAARAAPEAEGHKNLQPASAGGRTHRQGKAHKPYEFDPKVSAATTLNRSKGGHFVVHVKALPGNRYDCHTLAVVLPEMERQIGASIARVVADRGYRGHNAPPTHQHQAFISGQRRRVAETIKCELRRRSAVEPVIGHLKSGHRMGRNFLAHAAGYAANAVLAAVGYNFRRLLVWLRLLCAFLLAGFRGARKSEISPLPRERRSSGATT